MKTAIILHGTPSEEEFFEPFGGSQSNKHWIPWIQHQLLIRGYHASTPELPLPYQPDYELWRTEFERYDISERTLLVGHSCGGGFLLRWLSENPVKVRRVILIAPWIDPQARKCPEFFDFTIDPAITSRTELHVFYSDNDAEDIDHTVNTIKSELPAAKFRQFSGYGHFCLADMRAEAFPELLATLTD